MNQATLVRRRRKSRAMRTISRGLTWVVRNSVLTLMLFLILMWTFVPVLWAFLQSLKEGIELYTMPLQILPRTFSLDNYSRVFERMTQWPTYFKNSVITTAGAVATTVICSSLMGYAFARLDFRGRDLIFSLLIATIFAPQLGGLIAQYEVMYVLDLRNSLLGLVLLFASNLSVPAFIMRQTFRSMPGDIEDAARIDGAGRWRILLQIALPFAASGMVLVGILTFVNVYGEYLITITMIDDPSLYTLGIGLSMLTQGGTRVARGGTTVASYLVASVPAVLLFIMMQDYFVQGLSEGALKP
jgi:ABC-type glycerol-3-phosphate transport system permease component